jgi:hypothetical protein
MALAVVSSFTVAVSAVATGLSLTSGVTYTFSVYAKGNATVLLVFREGGTWRAQSAPITLTGNWVRYSFTWTCNLSSSDYRMVVSTPSTQTATFYLDGLQLNEGSLIDWSPGGVKGGIMVEEGTTNLFGANGSILGTVGAVPTGMGCASGGTLPAVSFIETGQFSGRDEHPSNFDPAKPDFADHIDVQEGAKFVASVIDALMASSSWKDSVFFWTFDEGGGLFDHVPPFSVPSPDGIPPQDLTAKDMPGDFTITGFRTPNFIVSPFARKNFVSHTPMDFTAYLKFIETRWKLPSLTARDAAMPDMTEFFDFNAVPWKTPPTPPEQSMSGVCDFNRQ